MRIDCTIDNKSISLNLNSIKPLSLVLKENFESSYSVLPNCRGGLCGLCVVLLDGKAVLSCLIPAFEIQNKKIETFFSFKNGREMQDIQKAYSALSITPCSECYEAKTLIFESLLRQKDITEEDVRRELGLIKCKCLTVQEAFSIIKKAQEFRKKRYSNASRS